MARPKKEINWAIVEKRLESGDSAVNISHIHNIDTDTFYLRFKENYGCSFQDYSAKFHSNGKANIAFTQYIKALEGNTNMLTLLGREWLGQGKEVVQKSPYEDLIELKHENMMLRAEIASIKEKLDADKS